MSNEGISEPAAQHAERVYTAVSYLGCGPMPPCDVCKRPFEAHGRPPNYECPAPTG